MDLTGRLKQALNKRKAENALRTLSQNTGLVDFVSNDYLGLSQSLFIQQSLLKQLHEQPLGTGSTGSRLLRGNSDFIESLENRIAYFHEAESALVFNSGYQANLGLLSCLLGKDDTILFDQYIHASLRQGIQLSYAETFGFRHNDLESLEKKLQFAKGHVVVLVESLYSMDGDEAPLKELVDFCESNECVLIVDEAHATGIRGSKGAGIVQEKGIQDKVFSRIHTFGKAIGNQGAAILGTSTLKDYLINFAKPFIYTTALPPLNIFAIDQAYQVFPELKDQREKVLRLGHQFEELLKEKGYEIIPGTGPIRSVIIPGNNTVKNLSGFVQKSGYDVRPILAPTIPKGSERLRVSFHSYNTEEEVNGLVEAIQKGPKN